MPVLDTRAVTIQVFALIEIASNRTEQLWPRSPCGKQVHRLAPTISLSTNSKFQETKFVSGPSHAPSHLRAAPRRTTAATNCFHSAQSLLSTYCFFAASKTRTPSTGMRRSRRGGRVEKIMRYLVGNRKNGTSRSRRNTRSEQQGRGERGEEAAIS